MSIAQFYREQAAEQRQAAEVATLANVREQCERAAASWDALAAHTDQLERLRQDRPAKTKRKAIAR